MIVPWLSAVGSFIVPGTAHAYYGRWSRAVALWAADSLIGASVLLSFTRLPGRATLLLCFAWLTFRLWIARDAVRLSRRFEQLSPPLAIYGWASIGGLLVGSAVVNLFLLSPLRHAAGEPYRIPSGAMEPTILTGDYIIVLPADTTRLARGALVVYRLVHDRTKSSVKRVVGLAGDTLSMQRGQLLVNGRRIEEPYTELSDTTDEASADFAWQREYVLLPPGAARAQYRPTVDSWGPIIVPPGKLFVLGDSRHESYDSRYWGFLAMADVVGSPRRVYFSRDPETGQIRWARIGIALR